MTTATATRPRQRTGRPWRRRRARVLRERGGTCGLCGNAIDPDLKYPHPMSFTVDHRRAVAHGGTDEHDNLGPAHLVCNQRRGAGRTLRTPQDRSANW